MMDFREEVGKLWGATTTYVLAMAAAVLPLLQATDPELLREVPAIRWVIFGLGLLAAVGRVLAPPPPSVRIHTEDEVSVDRESGTVTVHKARAIPAHIVDKAAGERSR